MYLGVYVVGDESEQRNFAKMLVRARCYGAKTIDDADVVIFTGGVDVSPELYGAKRHNSTWSSVARDIADIEIFLECLKKGVPMYGVCRGAQLLHVLNGGVLFQDVDNHNQPHDMWDAINKTRIDRISSVHHQACQINTDGRMAILGTSGQTTKRWLSPTMFESGPRPDIEAFYYRDTLCIGVQGHPEYSGYNYYTKWCIDLMLKYIVENPDTEWVKGSMRRIKSSILKERKFKVPESVIKFYNENKIPVTVKARARKETK